MFSVEGGGGGRGRADCFIFLTQVFSFDFYDGLHLKEAMLLKMRTIVLVAVVYFCLAGSKASLFYQGWERILLTSMGYFCICQS